MGNRGITMVELIIAVAISTIILGAATLLVKTAQDDYQYTSQSANLQSESQVIMEQLSKWIMEGNRIKIKVQSGKSDEIAIYYIPKTITTKLPSGVIPSIEKTKKKIMWVNDGRMYMKSYDNIANPDADTTTYSSADENEENCIGEDVHEFKAKVTKNLSDSSCIVNLKITLKHGTQEYKVENSVKVRNRLR